MVTVQPSKTSTNKRKRNSDEVVIEVAHWFTDGGMFDYEELRERFTRKY